MKTSHLLQVFNPDELSVSTGIFIINTAKKMKFSITDFLRIWSHLLRESLMENPLCSVTISFSEFLRTLLMFAALRLLHKKEKRLRNVMFSALCNFEVKCPVMHNLLVRLLILEWHGLYCILLITLRRHLSHQKIFQFQESLVW